MDFLKWFDPRTKRIPIQINKEQGLEQATLELNRDDLEKLGLNRKALFCLTQNQRIQRAKDLANIGTQLTVNAERKRNEVTKLVNDTLSSYKSNFDKFTSLYTIISSHTDTIIDLKMSTLLDHIWQELETDPTEYSSEPVDQSLIKLKTTLFARTSELGRAAQEERTK